MNATQRIVLAAAIVTGAAALVAAQDAARGSAPAGGVSLSFTTRPLAGRYSPRHVLAVWVTDSGGRFVKTLEVMAGRQKRRLQGWMGSSKGNEVDAVTGATLNSHQKVAVTWNGTDAAGKRVPDGAYRINVEYTESNAPGTATPIDVALGPAATPAKPHTVGNLTDVTVDYGKP